MSKPLKTILLAAAAFALFIPLSFMSMRNRPDAGQAAPRDGTSPLAAEAAPKQTATPVYEGAFELPITGATGYATTELALRRGANASAEHIASIKAGTAFRIIKEADDYWYIEKGDLSGWIAHKYCMINLPDVIPSIIYENTNASASRVMSSRKPVPGITGKALYDAKRYNDRLGDEAYIMPALYAMAGKICKAQQAALAEGNSLKIYEAYRPAGAQEAMIRALTELAQSDEEVMRGISAPPWKTSWFIALRTSNHQRGCAIDVGLVKVNAAHQASSGGYAYPAIADYSEYEMPTPIHELSIASAAFREPVTSTSKTAWKTAAPSKSMNEAAFLLQRYCTDAGLTPLASEWWHFNDLDAYDAVYQSSWQGRDVFTDLLSVAPADIS